MREWTTVRRPGTLGCKCADRWTSVSSRNKIGFLQACLCVEAVWKLRVGAKAYRLSQMASGLDEYYTGAGEAPGVWVGNGAGSLGLVGEVEPTELRAVLARLEPGTAHAERHDTACPVLVACRGPIWHAPCRSWCRRPPCCGPVRSPAAEPASTT
jgi:hypothetical protein